MKAKLTQITINSDNKFTEDQLNLLYKYLPSAKFQDFNSFKPYDYDKKTDEEKLKIDKNYQEYINSDKKKLDGYSHSFVCDLHIFMHDFPFVKFTVDGSREVTIDMENSDAVKLQQDAIDQLLKDQETKLSSMMKMFIKMSEKIADNLKIDTLNQKCDVHIGGGLLMTVNETMLLEDSCTDRLQSELNSGWRILAVTVQPDGRRPDYILGRFNPNLENDGRALR